MYGTAILYACAHCGPLVKLLSLIFQEKKEVRSLSLNYRVEEAMCYYLLVINSNMTTKYKGESS